MPDVPMIIISAIVIVPLAVLFGRRRSESPFEIALHAGGWLAFIIGIAWASNLAGEAFLAAALASGGMALIGEAIRLGGRRRERQATIEQRP